MNEKTFVCEYCGNTFIPNYSVKKGRIVRFCSKSCATCFQRQGYKNKTQLENAIMDIIKSHGRYMTKDEILKELKISSKTLVKFRVSILSLNNKMNMKKPQSVFEYFVGLYLEEIFDDLESQVCFNGCVSPKGYSLKFDYYSRLNNIVIEADGKQHKNKSHYSSSEYTLLCDEIKEKFCKENNIKIVRIPYSRNVTKEYVIKYIFN